MRNNHRNRRQEFLDIVAKGWDHGHSIGESFEGDRIRNELGAVYGMVGAVIAYIDHINTNTIPSRHQSDRDALQLLQGLLRDGQNYKVREEITQTKREFIEIEMELANESYGSVIIGETLQTPEGPQIVTSFRVSESEKGRFQIALTFRQSDMRLTISNVTSVSISQNDQLLTWSR